MMDIYELVKRVTDKAVKERGYSGAVGCLEAYLINALYDLENAAVDSLVKRTLIKELGDGNV